MMSLKRKRIASKKKEVEKLQSDMSSIQKDLIALQTHTGFTNLDGRLNLDKMERSVIDSKKGKMARDKNDYESNKVYTLKKKHNFPYSTTQKPGQTGQLL